MTTEAKPDTWMPLVIGDYLKDTGRLTTEQHGAYLLLIMDYWVNGPPPDSDDDLAAITKLDPRAWRKTREKLARFFQIVDGVWRHKRVDEELSNWTERKAKFSARAAAGGRAKAAKSSASSTPQAAHKQPTSSASGLLKSCSASTSREVDAPAGQSTLSEAKNDFLGPKEVRDAFVKARGEDWTAAYLDRCAWQDVPERALIPATRTAGTQLVREGRAVLAALGLLVLERAA